MSQERKDSKTPGEPDRKMSSLFHPRHRRHMPPASDTDDTDVGGTSTGGTAPERSWSAEFGPAEFPSVRSTESPP